jgi:hypothetical protein
MIDRRLRHGGPGRQAMSGGKNPIVTERLRNETWELSLILRLTVKSGTGGSFTAVDLDEKY